MSTNLTGVGGLGFRARQHNSSFLSPIAILLASLIVVLVGAGAGIIHASYSGIVERDANRAPNGFDEEDPSFLYREVHDAMLYGPADASLVYLWPLQSDAPLPPGLSSWPEPGQVVLSPALADADSRENIYERYGEVIGTIDESGLATSSELLAYVVPTSMPDTVATNVMYSMKTFGSKDLESPYLGQAANMEPLNLTLMAYFITIGIGAIVFCAIAIYQNREHWQRQSLVLYSLGYSRGLRLRWMIGQLWRPIATGTGIGLALLIPLFLTDIALPGREFTIRRGDMTDHWYLVLAYALISLLLLTTVVIRTAIRVPAVISTNRPRANERQFSPRRAAICFFSIPVAIILIAITQKTGFTYVFFIYLFFLLLVFATLIDLIGWSMNRVAGRIRSIGNENRNVGAIIGSAGIQHRVQSVAILAVAVAITIIIGAQIQSFLIAWSQSAREWKATYEQFNHEVLEVDAMPGSDLSQITTIIDRMDFDSNDYSLVLLETDCSQDNCAVRTSLMGGASNIQELYALNPAYTNFLFADTTPEISDLDNMIDYAIENQGNWDLQYRVSIVAPEGGALDASNLKQIIAEESTPMWRTTTPGTIEYYGSFHSAQTASWVGWMAVIGLTLVVWAIVISFLSDLRATIKRMAPLTVFANSENVTRSVSLIRVSVPIVLGVGIGSAVGLMLCAAVAVTFGSSITPIIPFFITCLIVTGLVALVGVLYSFVQAQRFLSTWKVGRW